MSTSIPLSTREVMILEEWDVPVHLCVLKSDILKQRRGSKLSETTHDIVSVKANTYSRTPLATKTRIQKCGVGLANAFWKEETAKIVHQIFYYTLEHKITKERVVVDVVETKNCHFKKERGIVELE